MNKKKISIALSILLTMSTLQSTYAVTKGLSNVSGVDNKISELKKHGYVEGYENGDLKLDNRITRAEITKLLVYGNNQKNIADALSGTKSKFKDVSVDYWANGVINTASSYKMKSNGLFMIQGYPDGTFRPNNNITNAELSKMLVVLTDENLTKEKLDEMNKDWPDSWINSAKSAGLMADLDIKDANKIVDRKEAFTMFYNGVSKKERNEDISSDIENKKTDNQTKDTNSLIKVSGKDTTKETIKIINRYIYRDNPIIVGKGNNDSDKSSKNDSVNNVKIDKEKSQLQAEFLEYIRQQKTLNPNLYNIKSDNLGRNILFTFRKIDTKNTIKENTEHMLNKALEHCDEITVAIGKNYVVINKDNVREQVGPLAGLFIKSTNIKDFINAAISKRVTKTAAVEIKKGNLKENIGYFNITFATEGYIFNTEDASLNGYEGNIEDIIKDNKLELPDQIIGQDVKILGKASFSNLNLEEIKLPAKLEIIDDDVFIGNNLKKLSLPENLKKIGNRAFAGTDNFYNTRKNGNEILKLSIPKTVTSIGSEAFMGNRITDLKLGDNITEIGRMAFARNNISKVELPTNLKEIEYGTFMDNKLTEVSIPESVKIIKENAFRKNNITKIKLNEGLQRIYDGAFSLNKIKDYIFPKSIELIENNAFRNQELNYYGKREFIKAEVSSKTKVFSDSFDRNVIIVRKGIDNFENIKSAKIKLNNLEQSLWEYESNNKNEEVREINNEIKILLDNNLATIEELNKKIDEVEKLIEKFKIENNVDLEKSKEALRKTIDEAKKINKTLEENNLYYIFDNLGQFEKTLDENDIKTINRRNNDLKEQIKNIYINDEYIFDKSKQEILKYIGHNVDITIPSELDNINIKSIAIKAFKSKGIKSVIIPDTVEKINDDAFEENGINNLVLGKNVKYIGISAFENNKLKKLIIPDTVEKINNNAFANNVINNLVLGKNVKYIENGAFANNELEKLTIPDSVISIGNENGFSSWGAFQDNNISELTMGKNVKQLGKNSFSYNKITSLKLNSELTLIPEECFMENKIDSLEIPSNITSVGRNAFSSCNINELILNDGIQAIEDFAFENNKISKLLLPKSLKYIDNGSFISNEISNVEIPEGCKIFKNSFDENVNIIELGKELNEDSKAYIKKQLNTEGVNELVEVKKSKEQIVEKDNESNKIIQKNSSKEKDNKTFNSNTEDKANLDRLNEEKKIEK